MFKKYQDRCQIPFVRRFTSRGAKDDELFKAPEQVFVVRSDSATQYFLEWVSIKLTPSMGPDAWIAIDTCLNKADFPPFVTKWAIFLTQWFLDIRTYNVLGTFNERFSRSGTRRFCLIEFVGPDFSKFRSPLWDFWKMSPISSPIAAPSCFITPPVKISWSYRDDRIWVRDFPELEIYIGNNRVWERVVIIDEMFCA